MMTAQYIKIWLEVTQFQILLSLSSSRYLALAKNTYDAPVKKFLHWFRHILGYKAFLTEGHFYRR